MNRTSRRVLFIILGITGALLIAFGTLIPRRYRSGLETARLAPRTEWWKDHMLKLPHPNTLAPDEIVANIQAIKEQTKLCQTDTVPVCTAPPGALRVRRVLRARMEQGPPEYIVVEFDDLEGRDAGVFVATREGAPILFWPPPLAPIPRPVDLADASARVEARLGRTPLSSEYLYFHNTLERGISLDRPLAVVTTDSGPIYFNSQGEAFVEQHTPLAKQLDALDKPSSTISNRSLVSVGHWYDRN